MVKIITKILAKRLQPHISNLVANNQTAFVKGRSMMESFLVTREVLAFCSKKKTPINIVQGGFRKSIRQGGLVLSHQPLDREGVSTEMGLSDLKHPKIFYLVGKGK